jgi:membrane protease YdiL (CAAX protease family)
LRDFLRRWWRRLDQPLRASPIGSALARPRWRAALGCLLAAGLVGLDLWGPFGYLRWWLRLLPFAAALPVYLLLARGDRPSLALRVRPLQGWGWWLKAGLLLGGAVLLVVGVVGLVVLAAGLPVRWPPRLTSPEYVEWLWRSCLVAPVVEESIYRFVLLTPLLPLIGRWPALGVNAAAFAWLHVLYGVAAPDNFAGGVVFGWAYLASGTLTVPMLLHAAGNLFVVGSNLVWNFVLFPAG